MAISPELEQKMNKLEVLNTRMYNIYSEMLANSRSYTNEIFKFNATASVRAKKEAVSVARKCFESNENLRIEFEKVRKEIHTVSDEVAKMMVKEQKDFIDQLYNCDTTGGINHGKDN